MIFYNPECDHRFTDYGIGIPIVGNRALKVFEELKKGDASLEFTDPKSLIRFTKEDLKLAHTNEYIENLFSDEETLKKEIMKSYELYNEKTGEFHRYNPNDQKKSFTHLRDVILSQAAMTYNSSLSALESGFSFNLGGGMHHAMSFGGRGFCLVNDIVVTLKKLRKDGRISKAWIIDVDVHKGDGAAELLVHDQDWVKTFSIHMKNGWPLNEGDSSSPWFIPSSLDIPIDENEEGIYLEKLKLGLEKLNEMLPNPDLVIVVNGADPFEADELPSASLIKLTKEQMLERDVMVYEFLKSKKIPQSYVMAGGYGTRSWEIWYQFLNFVR